MEQRIKTYEKFITTTKNPTRELFAYHQFMLQNFQHERLIHLIVTLFFAVLTLVSLVFSALALTTVKYTGWLSSLPIFALSLLLIILTAFYVKHYYFLENHIQKLYDLEAFKPKAGNHK